MTQVRSPNRERTEEQRIRAAYARREDEVPRGRYSPFQRGHLLSLQEVELQLLSLLKEHSRAGLSRLGILELGCGTGYWLQKFVQWGATPKNVTGVDLLPDVVSTAQARLPADLHCQCGSAVEIDADAEQFDLVCQFVMFSSVLDYEVRNAIAREMDRVLKPCGAIVWYDFHVNNPRNPDVRGVSRSDIRELFPGYELDLRRVTLAPPLGRVVGAASTLAYRALSMFPFVCTHYLGILEKPCLRPVPQD